MLNWRKVGLIVVRELRDQIRDQRTLFMVVVLPLLLYPALGLGMMELTLLSLGQPRTVVILGADQLPATPVLVVGDRFDNRWFRVGNDPERLRVVTDLSSAAPQPPPDAQARPGEARPLELSAERREELLRKAREVRARLQGAADPQSVADLFEAGSLEAVVLVPEGFREALARAERQIGEPGEQGQIDTSWPRLQIVFNKAAEKSVSTCNRTSSVLEHWQEEILAELLKRARLDASFTRPAIDEPLDVSRPEQVSASLWGRMFPALLIIMAVTGAFYPAIDLVAGEKERGTMETLLISPATRLEIVLGKFLTVMLFSMTTALLNLGSMGLTGRQLLAMAPRGASASGLTVSFPPPVTLFWLVTLLIPLSALFSALSLALATFARSSKEGQYYLTPLMMVTLGLTVFCLSPGTELTPLLCVLPVVGPALLLKALLMSPLQIGTAGAYIAPVLTTSFLYSGLALWWAVDQFHREEVLFREGDRFELVAWLKHLTRDRSATPTFAAAAACFTVIMLLQFFAGEWFPVPAASTPQPQRGTQMLWLVIAQQVLIIAGPALLMAVCFTRDPLRTLRLIGLRPLWVTGGILLAVCLHPAAVELQGRLQGVFGELPQAAKEMLQTLGDPQIPLWLVVTAIAVAPALCEELAFRGFLLSGFAHRSRWILAIVFSSIAFGVVHMIPQQVLNGALLGLLLGWLAIRSGSLWPGVAFHLTNNLLAIWHGRMAAAWGEAHLPGYLAYAGGDGLRYTTLLVIIGLVAAAAIVWGLSRSQPTRNDGPETHV